MSARGAFRSWSGWSRRSRGGSKLRRTPSPRSRPSVPPGTSRSSRARRRVAAPMTRRPGREQRVARPLLKQAQSFVRDSPSMPTRGSANAGSGRESDEQPSASATSGAGSYASFSETPFCASIKTTLAKSYRSPTQAQSSAWPVAVAGRDVVCIARTGSGKTCAFLLPVLHRIVGSKGRASEHIGGQLTVPSPSGLVLAPTRELAIQIGQEATRFGKPLGVRCVCLFGGMPKHNQINSLNGGANAYPHLVVATPGRSPRSLQATASFQE